MSSLEPPTSARVTIHTTKGPLHINLWARELPRLTRQFLQLCVDGEYNSNAFVSISKTSVGTGEPSGDSSGDTLDDEFHSRITFNQRGIVAFYKHKELKRHGHYPFSFFITLKDVPLYNKRFIAFGKVTDDSLYTLTAISDPELKDDGSPLYPARITSVEIANPFFMDLFVLQEREKSALNEPALKKLKSLKIVQSLDDEIFAEKEENSLKCLKVKSACDLQSSMKAVKKCCLRNSAGKVDAHSANTIDSTPSSENIDGISVIAHDNKKVTSDAWSVVSDDESYNATVIQTHNFIGAPQAASGLDVKSD